MFFTNAVVATAVLLSEEVIVPAVTLFPNITLPVKVGDANGAFKSNAACVNVEIGFAKSEVFSTFANPKFARAFAAFTAPVPPFTIATTPVTLVAVPLSVPTNDVALTFVAVTFVADKFPEKVLAVITLPSKLPLPSLLTKVLIKF